MEQKLFEVDRAVIGYFGSGPTALKLKCLFITFHCVGSGYGFRSGSGFGIRIRIQGLKKDLKC